MFKTLTKTAAVAATLGVATAAGAASIDAKIYQVKDMGGAGLSTPSKWVLVADVNGNGLAGFGIDGTINDAAVGYLTPGSDSEGGNTDSFLFDSGDQILASGGTNNFFGQASLPAEVQAFANFNLGSLTTDNAQIDPFDNAYLFVFDLAASATSPEAGTKFALFELPGGIPDSESATNTISKNSGSYNVNYSVVPEPASLAMLAVGAGLLLSRPKKNRKA